MGEARRVGLTLDPPATSSLGDQRRPATHRVQALRQASAEARTKAQAIAEALGVHLGNLLEASEAGVEVTPPRPVFFERAATPIQPGEMTVRATVTVHYAISGQ